MRTPVVRKRVPVKVPAESIAAELGRSRGATAVEANNLDSLRRSKRRQPLTLIKALQCPVILPLVGSLLSIAEVIAARE
jgi:hypothetical protein